MDQLLVKNLTAEWINQELVRSLAVAVEVFSDQIALNPLDPGAYYTRGITREDLNQSDLVTVAGRSKRTSDPPILNLHATRTNRPRRSAH